VPVWFLAVYVIVVAVAPAMLKLHERFGLAVPIALAVVATAVDYVRLATTIQGVEWTNFFWVFLFCQQVGFFWLDGRLDRRTWQPWALFAGGLTVLYLLTHVGPYPVSLVGVPGEHTANNAPPTITLIALGLAQAGLGLLAKKRLTNWLERPRVAGAVITLNLNAMTILLWHFTALVITAVIVLPLGIVPLFDAGSGAWWLVRIATVVVQAAPLAGLVWLFGRIERRAAVGPKPTSVEAIIREARSKPAPAGRRAVTVATTRVLAAGALCAVAFSIITVRGLSEPSMPLGVPVLPLTLFALGVALANPPRAGRLTGPIRTAQRRRAAASAGSGGGEAAVRHVDATRVDVEGASRLLEPVGRGAWVAPAPLDASTTVDVGRRGGRPLGSHERRARVAAPPHPGRIEGDRRRRGGRGAAALGLATAAVVLVGVVAGTGPDEDAPIATATVVAPPDVVPTGRSSQVIDRAGWRFVRGARVAPDDPRATAEHLDWFAQYQGPAIGWVGTARGAPMAPARVHVSGHTADIEQTRAALEPMGYRFTDTVVAPTTRASAGSGRGLPNVLLLTDHDGTVMLVSDELTANGLATVAASTRPVDATGWERAGGVVCRSAGCGPVMTADESSGSRAASLVTRDDRPSWLRAARRSGDDRDWCTILELTCAA